MKKSAGILVYRAKEDQLEVLIAHMGSPWWAKKDKGAWSIPKGEYEDEEPLAAAKREFKEELGLEAPAGEYIELGEIKQKNNKLVTAWAVEADVDVSRTRSNTFKLEWPPRSGQIQEYPEIDRAEWFGLAEAAVKIIPEQATFLERLAKKLGADFKLGKSDPDKQSSLF